MPKNTFTPEFKKFSMNPVIALAAIAELEQAVAWYGQREPGFGKRRHVAYQEPRRPGYWADRLGKIFP